MYEVPYFLRDFILSNDLCHILIKLLHLNPRYRHPDLDTLKKELEVLRDNIYQTPVMLRQILGHPFLPNESYQVSYLPSIVEFKSSRMNEFSLKYLAKYIFEHNVE